MASLNAAHFTGRSGATASPLLVYLPMAWMPERELTNDRRISDDRGERAHPAESADSRHGSSPQASDLDSLLSIDDFDLSKSLHIAGR
jgi:hypothetical protein